MGKDVTFRLKSGTVLTTEEIAMIEAARGLPSEYDAENPEIDPLTTPEQYAALMQAVARRNQRIACMRQKMG